MTNNDQTNPAPSGNVTVGALPRFNRQESDVIVIGAGLAGSTAARLFALDGLRVGLVESHRDVQTFKQLCTHFIQPSAYPVLRRIGLDQLIERAGGVRNGIGHGAAAGRREHRATGHDHRRYGDARFQMAQTAVC